MLKYHEKSDSELFSLIQSSEHSAFAELMVAMLMSCLNMLTLF